MTDRVFIDSNIWVYFFAEDDHPKTSIVVEFFADSAAKSVFITSCQVVNEVSNVLKRFGLSEEKLRIVIEKMTDLCLIQELSKEVSLLASTLRENYSFSFWDSIIVATAKTAECDLLISEDMHDGLTIGELTIRNIFSQSQMM